MEVLGVPLPSITRWGECALHVYPVQQVGAGVPPPPPGAQNNQPTARFPSPPWNRLYPLHPLHHPCLVVGEVGPRRSHLHQVVFNLLAPGSPLGTPTSTLIQLLFAIPLPNPQLVVGVADNVIRVGGASIRRSRNRHLSRENSPRKQLPPTPSATLFCTSRDHYRRFRVEMDLESCCSPN